MKKKKVIKLFLMSFLFVFLLSGVFALDPGKCEIIARSSCTNSPTTGYIVMGVSSLINAHGELATEGNYDYVLCCNVGTGDRTCSGTNKIIGLSDTTNAHAEIPSANNYETDVCYEDFNCIGTTADCGTGIASSYPAGLLSLSSTTDAHIGVIDHYNTKICCSSIGLWSSTCTPMSAKWNIEEAIEGQKVYLQVTGNGLGCDGKSVSFEVMEGGLISQGPAQMQPANVSFNGATAIGTWNAEWIDDAGSDPEYYFTATMINNPGVNIESSDPKLSVIEIDEDYCAAITTCDGYTNKEECDSDETLCNVAGSSSLPGVDCSDESIICGCAWDNSSSTCGFSWNEIEDCGTPESGCNYGCTLCENGTGTYCNVGATCPSGEIPTNNNGSCDSGIDGCSSDDCLDGDRDSCASPFYCSAGKCSSVEGPPSTSGLCSISQTIDKDCDDEPVGYKSITWIGTWNGEGECGAACQKCEVGGKTTIPCPSQIQLPFFDYYQIIIAVIVIAAIYVSMIIRRKFLKKKK